ncbi:HK [Lepeophtheirus salmonis]|uniref:Phosphotransferase n=1 Tax=Lepeophtheirus salmonis TaxID=72036 RepID=A0A7R8H1P3_LEPSM|nr:HK [Lepeophtheirus salmonis]CAF2815735.1 HK [Lepeophtheirus salmonis]
MIALTTENKNDDISYYFKYSALPSLYYGLNSVIMHGSRSAFHNIDLNIRTLRIIDKTCLFSWVSNNGDETRDYQGSIGLLSHFKFLITADIFAIYESADPFCVIEQLNDKHVSRCLMTCASIDHRCRIGLILGTGTNACYLEKVKDIQLIDQYNFQDHDHMLVNTEWGGFGENGCFYTRFASEIESDPVGDYTRTKAVLEELEMDPDTSTMEKGPFLSKADSEDNIGV